MRQALQLHHPDHNHTGITQVSMSGSLTYNEYFAMISAVGVPKFSTSALGRSTLAVDTISEESASAFKQAAQQEGEGDFLMEAEQLIDVATETVPGLVSHSEVLAAETQRRPPAIDLSLVKPSSNLEGKHCILRQRNSSRVPHSTQMAGDGNTSGRSWSAREMDGLWDNKEPDKGVAILLLAAGSRAIVTAQTAEPWRHEMHHVFKSGMHPQCLLPAGQASLSKTCSKASGFNGL